MGMLVLCAPLALIVLAVVFRKWWLVVPAILSLGWYWMAGAFIIAFGALHKGAYVLTWTMMLVGVALLLLRLKLPKWWLVWCGLALALAFPLTFGSLSFYDWWTKGRFAKLENRVDWREFEPFAPTNRLVAATAAAKFLFATNEPTPSVECAYAIYPIGAAAMQALCPREAFEGRRTVRPVSSPRAYDELTWSTTPCIALVLAPSAEQIADAKEKGVAFELTPIAKDAFVFFVPVTNPIESLTSEQVRSIYSERIKTWRELGVDLDAKLVPYQRNKGSGSQSALERLMGDEPIMEPLKEDHLRGMGGIISEAADYRNRPGALGFSFRYYMEELVKEKNVKILKIDGVAPTVENIRSGAYPFVETAYAVTTGERKGNVRRFIDFLVSPAGRDLVERTGYVAVGGVSAAGVKNVSVVIAPYDMRKGRRPELERSPLKWYQNLCDEIQTALSGKP